ncbi:MAG: hypothetical protein AB7S26_08380 [Sandaracinaceae bacterium]
MAEAETGFVLNRDGSRYEGGGAVPLFEPQFDIFEQARAEADRLVHEFLFAEVVIIDQIDRTSNVVRRSPLQEDYLREKQRYVYWRARHPLIRALLPQPTFRFLASLEKDFARPR